MVYIPADFLLAQWLRTLRDDPAPDREHKALVRSLRAGWVDMFTMRMSVLGVRAAPEALAAMAKVLFATQGHIDPFDAADAEFLEWQPLDD
jgi:hypothetical protein